MKKNLKNASFDQFDDENFPRAQTPQILSIIDRIVSRRGFLSISATTLAAASLPLIQSKPAQAKTTGLVFEAVKANVLDTVTIPPQFNWKVLTSWGEPMWSNGKSFDEDTRGTAATQLRAVGDNNDGMAFFSKSGRHVLAVNNEYINKTIMWGNRFDRSEITKDDIEKSQAGHGITIFEVAKTNGKDWMLVKDASVNRRITANTPMEITGPAAGLALLKTKADPTGRTSLGTWNNCANGRTPWGTYLTCEENFNGYFSTKDKSFKPTKEMHRYGVGHRDWGYGWAKIDDRFDISKTPNECNRNGYVVEIDPFDPTSTPKKRTALGRFKHENAELVVTEDGQVVVYMGDDERGEFIYRFISDKKFVDGGDNTNLLESGALYVAKFNDDQTGQWLELSPQTTGMKNQGEVCVHARLAASKVGATTMDRPEWIASHPNRAEVYCCLTNNKNRGRKPNRGGDATPVGGPNPRKKNRYGQIVRWRPKGEDHTASEFEWDLFVIAGNPKVHKNAYAGSQNITEDNMFNSPDGLAFDSTGLLWIMTDGKTTNEGDFEGMGNNQMLAADPDTGEIRRFMVGPNSCEITGLTWSSDKQTMFVGIQHPGDKTPSHFPNGGDSVPRSSIVAITRKDGGAMG